MIGRGPFKTPMVRMMKTSDEPAKMKPREEWILEIVLRQSALLVRMSKICLYESPYNSRYGRDYQTSPGQSWHLRVYVEGK